jgi:hypothetical protein
MIRLEPTMITAPTGARPCSGLTVRFMKRRRAAKAKQSTPSNLTTIRFMAIPPSQALG